MKPPSGAKRSCILPEIDDGIDINSEYYKRNVLPVDKGWAWVICFAGFMVYFVFGVANQTLVVLFVEIIYYYDSTITMASLMFMFSVFSVGFMSIVSTNFITPRFGEKKVVSTAGIVNMVGSLGLSISPNIGTFIVFSVIKGLAAGAVFVPSISLIRLYFLKRRSIAQIIANVGQSAAVILTPAFVRLIRKHYGIGGTFIIVAGLELHMTVAGLLLRPVSFYKFRPRVIIGAQNDLASDVMMSEDYNELKLRKSRFILPGKRFSMLKTIALPSIGSGSDSKDESAASSVSTSKEHIAKTAINTKLSNISVKSIKFQLEYTNKQQLKTSSKGYSKSLDQEIPQLTDSNESGKRTPQEDTKENKLHKSRRVSSLLERKRYWIFRLVLLSTLPGSANLYLRNYIPTIMDSQGATHDQSAYLLTIVGACDLVSRICIGLFSDLHILSSVQIIIISQLCLATICHSLRYFTTIETLIPYAFLTGCFVGTRITVLPLLSLEIVGVDKMPQALSIISTVGVLASAFMNPIFGYIAERENNFVTVMHAIGGCFTLSSIIMLCVPFIGLFVKKRPLSRNEFTDIEIAILQKKLSSKFGLVGRNVKETTSTNRKSKYKSPTTSTI